MKSTLTWGVAERCLAGETATGDRHVVKRFPRGALIAVVDGLGHGAEAAEAAGLAVQVLELHAEEAPVCLVQRCHDALHGTRGVVMSLASIHFGRCELTWLGVGNVEGVLMRAQATADTGGVRSPATGRPGLEHLLLRGGVVGHGLPPLRPATTNIGPRDRLAFASDGIGSGFAQLIVAGERPQCTADRILAHCAKAGDDALVVVAALGGDRA